MKAGNALWLVLALAPGCVDLDDPAVPLADGGRGDETGLGTDHGDGGRRAPDAGRPADAEPSRDDGMTRSADAALDACPAGQVDLNGAPGDGCEYACTRASPGVEVCNGLDDDCNGEVDEGFDLDHDPANCGACGAACAPYANGRAVCRAGQCGFGGCDRGRHDENFDLSDGCERLRPAGTFYVDSAADPDTEDGTAEHPFTRLAPALAQSNPGDVILATGVFEEPVVLNKPFVRLEGLGELVITAGDQPAVVLESRFVTLASARLNSLGHPIAVHIECDGCVVRDVSIHGLGEGLNDAAVGIRARNSQGIRLLDNRVLEARSAAHPLVGIETAECSRMVVAGNEVAGLIGGSAPPPPDDVPPQVFGLQLISSTGRVTRNWIHDLDGGDASGAELPRLGGSVWGIRPNRCAELVVSGNIVADLTGGAGAAELGGDAVGIGVLESGDLSVAENDVRGLRGGSPGGRAAGLVLDRVVGGPQVVGNRVNQVAGGGGQVQPEFPAGDATGVWMNEAEDATIRNTLITRIGGGHVHGVRLKRSGGARLTHATIAHLNGAYESSGARVEDSPETVIDHTVFAVTSGPALEGGAVSWSLAFDADAPDWAGALEGPGLQVADPLFVDPDAGDFEYRPDSPAVDGGDLDADCGLEPGGASCRLDLGHRGGTRLGQSR